MERLKEYKAYENSPGTSDYMHPATFGSTVRTLALALATVTTGLVAGLFYDWSVAITPGLSDLSDAAYVETTGAITERIANPLFFASFLGAVLFLLLALSLHLPRPQRSSARFWLIVSASALYIVGGLFLTLVVNAPMSYQLAAVDPEAPARVLAETRDAYEATWNFWHGVRTILSALAFLALVFACLLPGTNTPKRANRVR